MSSDSRTTALPAIVVGRYRIVTLIAHGGMGSLYLARDPAIDRTIALKLLQKGFDDEAARERFAREARAAGRLRHPNIVTVFDVGEHDHQPFIAMEYVPGETLDQLIRRRTPLSIANRLLILEDLCSGLHFAHTEGVVHRDIKPANVILDVAGTIKILDFGLARASDSAITRAGDQLGTLNYMSPEQVLGAHLDHRSDIYSVGALAYELISYERAFPGTVQDGTMYRILNTQPKPLITLVPDLDPDIARTIERAMSKEPEQRYQNLDDMREEFAIVRRRLESAETASRHDVGADGATESASVKDSVRALSPLPARPSRARALAGVARDSAPYIPDGPESSAATLGRSSAAVSTPRTVLKPRGAKGLVIASAAVVLFVAGLAFVIYRGSQSNRPVAPSGAATSPTAVATAQPPAPTASTPVADRTQDRATIDERLKQIHETAARQIAAGERPQLLETLSAGLYLDRNDVELNRMIDDLKRGARQFTVQARANASRRGATESSSAEFRDGVAREREGESFDRSGDRTQAIRALWAATESYNRATGTAARGAAPAVAAAPVPPVPPPVAAHDAPPPAPIERQPSAVSPPPAPSPSDKPPPAAVAATPVPSTGSSVDPARDARANDVAMIQDTLRRYADAYGNRDVAAVRKVLPSLNAQQLRSLEKDFSDYRSYSVEIADQRISVDRDTAVANCQVTRSFVTRSGVAGGHTVATTFRLRKVDAAWVIDRLESR